MLRRGSNRKDTETGALCHEPRRAALLSHARELTTGASRVTKRQHLPCRRRYAGWHAFFSTLDF